VITDTTPPLDHERTRVIVLTDDQIEAIAEKVEERFYAKVGKRVVERILQAIGIGAAVLMAWLGAKGLLK
jgi:hypothetical protein